MAKKQPMPKKEDPENSSEGESVDDEADSDDDVSMDDDEGEDLDPEQPIDGSVPFLDSFYGLASENPAERAQSAHAMLSHCLLGPTANTKDASYALKRLMNGLCSGRAGARQGYASALTSFLKIAQKMDELSRIQSEIKKEQEEMVPDLVFVREQLATITDPKRDEGDGSKFGKKKGSEERDFLFGRLFGILSIVRSAILVPRGDVEVELASRVTCDLANDLIALHNYKKWMREPAAHAIINLLSAFYNNEDSLGSMEAVDVVVRKAIVPKLFEFKATDFTDFSAEQLAVALYIQCHAHLHKSELPTPLNQSILSSSTLPVLAKALSSTSSVVHPRMHVVWDVIWSYLTEVDPRADSSKKSLVRRLRLKESCPVSEEKASGIVKALMDNVIEKALLGANINEHGKFHATHERKALALTLVKVLGGGEHQSSHSGKFILSIDQQVLEESILSETVIRKLFLDVIAAGSGGGPRQNSHLLKPLASNVLESLVGGTLIDFDCTSEAADKPSNAIVDHRLAYAKCFLRCDPRFDARTKTSTVSNLLLLDETDVQVSAVARLWEEYAAFLEGCILRNGASPEAMGYIDLLLSLGKKLVRTPTKKNHTIMQILGFLMCTAFFDCSTLVVEDKPKDKEPKSGSSALHPFIVAGLRVQPLLNINETPKYSTRTVLSSRFYSLLADFTSFVPPRSLAVKGTSESRQTRESSTFDILSDVFQGWELLLGSGAKTVMSVEDLGTMQEEDEAEKPFEPRRFISELRKKATEASVKYDDAPSDTTHFLASSFILAMTLYLHLLSCGSPADLDEESESDDDDSDESEVTELLSDVNEVLSDLLKFYDTDGAATEEDANPVVGLAELCANVLSSHFCAGSLSRGASSKLLREGVHRLWTGCLESITRPSAQDNSYMFDDSVLQVLLTSVGASFDCIEGDDDVEDEDEASGDEGETQATFSCAAGEALHIEDSDSDEAQVVEKASQTSSDDESKDVEIDEGRLQSMLLEDSEADISDNDEDVLEHHAAADAALVQLIKLKQDARKAGRLARERLELSNNLRCVTLFEVLLTKMSRTIPPDFVLKMMVPLLRLCKSLEKSLALSSSSNLGKKAGADNEKKALLDKVTSLLKAKVCKARISKHVNRDLVLGIAEELMDELRRSTSAEYTSCCSSCEVAAIKSLSDIDDIIVAAEVYTGAVVEWTTKRTTRLQANTFEDLIQQLPGVAQMKLAGPLAEACKEARSPFLKSESFRLMTSLFARSVADEKLSNMGKASLHEASSSLAAAVVDALQNEDMKKTKRVRDVLKAAGKLVAFVVENNQIDSLLSRCLKEMRERLASLKDNTESSGVSNTCGQLLRELDELLSKNETTMSNKTESILSTKSKKKKKKKDKKK